MPATADNNPFEIRDDENKIVSEGVTINEPESSDAVPSGQSTASRVPTGIKGLDDIMEGGLEKGSLNIISGGPGTGKSTFCIQYLAKGISEFNENGIYITFEEKKEKVYNHMLRFGWDLEKYEKENKFRLLEYKPHHVKKILEEGAMSHIEGIIKEINAKRIVVDSLTGFSLLFEKNALRREGVLNLFDMISSWGGTAMLTVERSANIMSTNQMDVEFLADGVFIIYNFRKSGVRERALEILKLRGTKFESKLVPMSLGNDGVTVYPKETVFLGESEVI